MRYFDSLVHFNSIGLWPSSSKDISLPTVLRLLNESPYIYGAILQSSPWFSDELPCHSYVLSMLFANSLGQKLFFYCASLPSRIVKCPLEYIEEAYAAGVRIFKIHPRFSDLSSGETIEIICRLIELDVSVQLCTYGYSRTSKYLYLSNISFWGKLIDATQHARRNSIMLMHLGATHCLDMHSIIRHSPQFIGDLSMTLTKYSGSHLDQDISFLINCFDRRIVVGSDYPEYSPEDVIKALNRIPGIKNVDKQRVDRVLYSNALDFSLAAYSA
jgi:predicted TIM-barrel fold metal-dependent hydrolase